MKINIYLVRHGQTYGNKYNIILGNSDTDLKAVGVENPADPESDLTELGITQAKLAGMMLKQILTNKSVDLVFSSPRLRAKSTARFIIQEMGYDGQVLAESNLVKNVDIVILKNIGKSREIFVVEELREFDAGEYEGICDKTEKGKEFRKRVSNCCCDFRCGGSVETVEESGKRLKECIEKLSEKIFLAAQNSDKNEVNVVMVSHSFAMKQFLEIEKYSDNSEIENGESIILKYENSKLSIVGREKIVENGFAQNIVGRQSNSQMAKVI